MEPGGVNFTLNVFKGLYGDERCETYIEEKNIPHC